MRGIVRFDQRAHRLFSARSASVTGSKPLASLFSIMRRCAKIRKDRGAGGVCEGFGESAIAGDLIGIHGAHLIRVAAKGNGPPRFRKDPFVPHFTRRSEKRF